METELDPMFLRNVYLVVDKNFSSFNLQFQMEHIFECIADIYKHRSLWNTTKLNYLTSQLMRINRVELVQHQPASQLSHLNNINHRMIYLINYFKQSTNNSLRFLAAELAFNCLRDLLNKNESNDLATLLDNSNVNCHKKIFLVNLISFFVLSNKSTAS